MKNHVVARFVFAAISLAVACSALTAVITRATVEKQYKHHVMDALAAYGRAMNEKPQYSAAIADSIWFPVRNAGDAKIFIYFKGKEHGPYMIQPGMTRVFTIESQGTK